MLPNLLVIGAAKCGTTSLHAYLDEHPDVAMSQEKELNFFVAEKNLPRGLGWYERQFDGAPVRGESSPAYTAYPFVRGVPERIYATLPDVRLIYLVRDPIDRIVSHYLHRLLAHPSMGSLEEALANPSIGPRLIGLSRYWLQLEQYLAHFSADQILVLDSHELRARPAQALARVFKFLELDQGYRPADLDRRENPAPHIRRTRTGLALLKGVYRMLGPTRAHALVSRAPATLKAPFRRPVERPQVTGELRERLALELSPEIERLRRFTGLDLSGWSL